MRNNHAFGAEMRLISAILFVVEFVRGAVLVSLLPIYGAKTLGLAPDVIGAAISAHYLVDTMLKMAIGYLLDRFSIRIVVQVGLIVSLAGVVLLRFAELPWMFIGAAALYGIGMSPIWIACLTKVSAQQRAAQMGLLYTVWMVGLGSGPIVCTILLDVSVSFTYNLLVSLSAAACLLTLFVNRTKAQATERIPLGKQLNLLKGQVRSMRLLLPGMILQTAGASMLVPILPGYAEQELGLSGAQYSILLTTGGLTAIASLIPMGKLSDRLTSKKWFLVAGFGVFGFGLWMLASGLAFCYCLLISAMLGLSYSAILPAWNALLATYVPPKQEGVGWGMLSTFEGFGVMIGPAAGGLLAAQNGESSVFWTSAALFGLIGLFYLWLPKRAFATTNKSDKQVERS
ncbi:MFS family permease [Paenibacillus endophyticus]|uniref:MFS family permease n=1 Tax=Paenibacillus endophyticus TaxID=1294268 RepID=A0A7W5GB31_9BACL|nr:MFS transporter [Paenibacillus endophyticus]MBB3153371.1 MFS family permease [Paenibacillus endophyticus]